MTETLVRQSRYAGSFYPGNATHINNALENYKNHSGMPEPAKHPPIMILPHAGWQFSGLAAVKGVLTLVADPPSTIVMIGPAHRHLFLGFSIAGYDSYETPLGNVEVDRDLRDTLKDHTGFDFEPEAHIPEHSLEVIIPMLQHFLPKKFKILPILAGSVSKATIGTLADALASNLDPLTDSLIISSDLSHYYPYEQAREFDKETMGYVLDGDIDLILERSGEGGRLACGYGGIGVAIELAKRWGLGSAGVIIYYNSGDRGAGHGEVVGYASIAWPAPSFETDEKDTGD